MVSRWQRETRVRSFTPRKIIGEVVYITPCDRKLRNYNEVDKVGTDAGLLDLSLIVHLIVMFAN